MIKDGAPEFELGVGVLKAYDEANPNACFFNKLMLTDLLSVPRLNWAVGNRMLIKLGWTVCSEFYDQELLDDHKHLAQG